MYTNIDLFFYNFVSIENMHNCSMRQDWCIRHILVNQYYHRPSDPFDIILFLFMIDISYDNIMCLLYRMR